MPRVRCGRGKEMAKERADECGQMQERVLGFCFIFTKLSSR